MTGPDIEDLLVEWELARQRGRVLSAEELCKHCPQMLDELKERIHRLQSTSWVMKPDSVEPRQHLFDTAVHAVTIHEFVDALSDSSVLTADHLDRIRQHAVPASEDADALARRLVREGLITEYQAAVLLKQQNGPLLLDRYVILDTIGSGGMGLVFKALHRSMERVVALKVLPGAALNSPPKVSRFQREIRAAARLSHPHVVSAFDAHEDRGTHFLVMEFVDGPDLSQHVRKNGPLSVEEAVRLVAQTAGAMEEAHQQGIIHRDIKPSNVLLAPDGSAKLLDLGLARIREPDGVVVSETVTDDGAAMGTLAFMSPEQALNARNADPRSDIYSLGCTLFHLVTGRVVHSEETAVEMIVAHREKPAPDLREFRADIPSWLNELFMRMVARDPSDRPQSMAEVRSLLVERAGSFNGAAHGEVTRRSPGRRKKRGDGRCSRTLERLLQFVGAVGLVLTVLTLLPHSLTAHENDREVADWVLRNGGTAELETAAGRQFIYDSAALPDEDFHVTAIDLTTSAATTITPPLMLSRLEVFRAGQFALTLQQIQQIAASGQLRVLEVPDCGLNDADLELISELDELTYLDLAGNSVSDKGASCLRSSQKLETLILDDTDLSDAGLRAIQGLMRLNRLEIAGTLVTPDGLSALEGMSLQSLDLQEMRLNAEQLQILKSLKGLLRLRLYGCDLSDGDFYELTQLPLSSLTLCGMVLAEQNVEQLSQMSGLKVLDLSGCDVPGRAFASLCHLTELQELSLIDIQTGKHALRSIGQLASLRILDLTGTTVEDQQLQYLDTLHRLESLILDETLVSHEAADDFQMRHAECSVVFDTSLISMRGEVELLNRFE